MHNCIRDQSNDQIQNALVSRTDILKKLDHIKTERKKSWQEYLTTSRNSTFHKFLKDVCTPTEEKTHDLQTKFILLFSGDSKSEKDALINEILRGKFGKILCNITDGHFTRFVYNENPTIRALNISGVELKCKLLHEITTNDFDDIANDATYEIALNSPILMNGLEIVNSPLLGKSSETTKLFFAQLQYFDDCNCLCYVFNNNYSLSVYDAKYLNKIWQKTKLGRKQTLIVPNNIEINYDATDMDNCEHIMFRSSSIQSSDSDSTTELRISPTEASNNGFHNYDEESTYQKLIYLLVYFPRGNICPVSANKMNDHRYDKSYDSSMLPFLNYYKLFQKKLGEYIDHKSFKIVLKEYESTQSFLHYLMNTLQSNTQYAKIMATGGVQEASDKNMVLIPQYLKELHSEILTCITNSFDKWQAPEKKDIENMSDFFDQPSSIKLFMVTLSAHPALKMPDRGNLNALNCEKIATASDFLVTRLTDFVTVSILQSMKNTEIVKKSQVLIYLLNISKSQFRHYVCELECLLNSNGLYEECIKIFSDLKNVYLIENSEILQNSKYDVEHFFIYVYSTPVVTKVKSTLMTFLRKLLDEEENKWENPRPKLTIDQNKWHLDQLGSLYGDMCLDIFRLQKLTLNPAQISISDILQNIVQEIDLTPQIRMCSVSNINGIDLELFICEQGEAASSKIGNVAKLLISYNILERIGIGFIQAPYLVHYDEVASTFYIVIYKPIQRLIDVTDITFNTLRTYISQILQQTKPIHTEGNMLGNFRPDSLVIGNMEDFPIQLDLYGRFSPEMPLICDQQTLLPRLHYNPNLQNTFVQDIYCLGWVIYILIKKVLREDIVPLRFTTSAPNKENYEFLRDNQWIDELTQCNQIPSDLKDLLRFCWSVQVGSSCGSIYEHLEKTFVASKNRSLSELGDHLMFLGDDIENVFGSRLSKLRWM